MQGAGVIQSFADKTTRLIHGERLVKGFPADILKRALRKLRLLDAASTLGDLAAVPGNHLEALQGDRIGQYSVRISQQWRLCFRWEDQHAYEVQVVDYH
jgi:proteic killer suppression protein